jgi:hypothetical protein
VIKTQCVPLKDKENGMNFLTNTLEKKKGPHTRCQIVIIHHLRNFHSFLHGKNQKNDMAMFTFVLKGEI